MKNISLYDYLQLTEDGEEITVNDQDYDTETYFYKRESDDTDLWSESIEKLSQLLKVTKIRNNSVEVNLSDIIEKKITQINESDLFNDEMDIDDIMDTIESIISGNVSETWMEKFVDILSK